MKLERRIVSGARVHFDPRTTAEIDATRDMTKRTPRKKKKAKDVPSDRR